MSISDIEVDYPVKGIVHLSNGESYPVHYRWSTEEEDQAKREIVEENEYSMEEYYKKFLLSFLL